MCIAADANTETNVLDRRRWGVTVIGPMKIGVYLCAGATSDNKAAMVLALSCAREPRLPRLSASLFNQRVFTLPQAWMSLRSPLTMGIRSETHHASHTPQTPSPTLPEAWKSVWECMWAQVGECVCVYVFVSLLRHLSRIDMGLMKPNDDSGGAVMTDLRPEVTR